MKESYMRIITEGKRRCLPISVHELCNAPRTGSGTLESDVCVTVKKALVDSHLGCTRSRPVKQVYPLRQALKIQILGLTPKHS